MKTLAYKSQYGHEIITPLEAKMQNVGTVYSTHAAGTRLEMHVSHRLDTYYFAYTPKNRNSPGVTGPESLTHVLCKKAIASLAREGTETKLALTHKTREQPEISIKFLHGENEHTFEVDGEKFTVDVYCQFESRNPDNEFLSLSSKWNGKIAFEVFVTHGLASNDRKVVKLAEIGIPIVQIRIKSNSPLYLDEDRDLTNSKTVKNVIENHIRKLENMFKKRIYGVLLKDVMSKTYDHEIQMIQAIKEKDELIDELKLEADKIKIELREEQASNSEQRNLCASLREQNSDLQQLLSNQSIKSTIQDAIEMPNSNSLLNRLVDRFRN